MPSARFTVDLDALAANLATVRALAGSAEVAPVVKADAYGLGLTQVALRLWAEGARSFFVARTAGGEALRDLLPSAEIWVLDGCVQGSVERLIAARLKPVLNSRDQVARWSQARGGPAALHIDTGMNRLGLDARELGVLAADHTLLHGIDPETADLSDAALAAAVADWLAPHLHGVSRLADVAALDLHGILRGLLGWERAARLDRDLPTHLPLPGGRAAIDYTQPVPLASARAQAFYGLAASPLLAGGQVPLQLALLSPAGRPVAITADLAGFWRGAWADARKDMRGRYPRHDWPENPGSAK